MRDELLYRLNKALETDHNLIEEMLLKPRHVLIAGGQRVIFDGKINALHMLCDLANMERIYPVYENDIIQRFE